MQITIGATACAANFTTARNVSMRLFSAVMPVNRCSISRFSRYTTNTTSKIHSRDSMHMVQRRPLANLDQHDPIPIDLGQFLFVLDSPSRSARFF